MRTPKIQHIKFSPDIKITKEFDGFDVTLHQKMYAEVIKATDKLIYQAIINYCREQGFNDLFIIDEEFVKSAIKNEIVREKTMNCKNGNHSCNSCGEKKCGNKHTTCHNADMVEVRHGRWLEQYEGSRLLKCSVCGYEYCDLIECGNYCGNCGAKMDAERSNQ